MLNIVPVLDSVGLQSVNIVCIGLDNHLLSIFSVHRVCISNGFADILSVFFGLFGITQMVNVVLCGSVQMDYTALNPAYFLLLKDATVLHVHLCFHFDRS